MLLQLKHKIKQNKQGNPLSIRMTIVKIVKTASKIINVGFLSKTLLLTKYQS